MNRQTYAYAVCLAAVIALLITIPRAIGAALDYRDPLHVKQPASEVELGTFEAYKEDVARRKNAAEFFRWLDADKYHDPARDYEAARNERVGLVQLEARRSVISNGG